MTEPRFRAFFNENMTHSNILCDFFDDFQKLKDGGNNPILTQYIGLKDKDGREIFDGDLVEKREYNGQEERTNKYKVVFDHGGFCLESCDNGGLYSFGSANGDTLRKEKIIGNIFETIN